MTRQPLKIFSGRLPGKPSLGPRQAALIDAVVERLRAPQDRLSSEELRILEWLTRILGFDPSL